MKTEDFVGKTIKDFKFTGETLTFDLYDNDTRVFINAYGDCCSSSWFEEVTGEEALQKGAYIHEFRLVEMDDLSKWDKDEYELTQYYSIKIKTDKGYADIEMRNTSNGYYGGYIEIDSSNDPEDELYHSKYHYFWENTSGKR